MTTGQMKELREWLINIINEIYCEGYECIDGSDEYSIERADTICAKVAELDRAE